MSNDKAMPEARKLGLQTATGLKTYKETGSLDAAKAAEDLAVRGPVKNITLDPDDPGLADPEGVLFELMYTGVLPRSIAVYVVPEGRSVIIDTAARLNGTNMARLKPFLLEIGDVIFGRYLVIEPLWKARILLDKKFGWGLETSPDLPRDWRVA